MGFSFLETGFFFTLAITFLLMLLLVYHFKQRLVSSEQKQDTMFEIINNLVTEINMLKGTIALIQRPPTPYPFTNESVSQEIKEFKENTETLEDSQELIVVSDDDSDDDDISVEEFSDEDFDVDEEDNIEELKGELEQELQEELKDTTELEEPAIEIEEKQDFSKMTLGELKTYILNQGWVEDASKMKKTQILNLIKENNN